MALYRKKPVVIEAIQWFKQGDHPKVKPGPMKMNKVGNVEGTRLFVDVSIPEENGWIETPENAHEVTPGDWIIKGVNGEFYPCKPDIFEKTYESA